MRPFLALLALVGVAILVTWIASRGRPYNYTESLDSDSQQKQDTTETQKKAASNPDRLKAFDKVKEGAVRVTMSIENRGDIVLELYPKAAPKTVAHFVELVKQHFYDGILFHRYAEIQGADGKKVPFVVQAGDPKSKKINGADIANIPEEEVGPKYGLGDGGSGKTVPLETGLPHLPGSIGLARATAPDSGDSQFYINLADNSNLDSGYCVFGRIVQGEEIAHKIRQGDRIAHITSP